MKPNAYIAFDLETTGLNSRECEIIEIAAIKVCSGSIVDSFETLVKPTCRIPDKVVWLTGISDEDVSCSPNVKDVIPHFLNFIGSSILLGHNIATFDMHVLNRYSELVTGNSISNQYIDTLPLFRKLLPQLNSHSLSDIADYYHISPDDSHRALTDAKTVHECYLNLLNDYPTISIEPRTFGVSANKKSHKSVYTDVTRSLQTLQGFLLGIIADDVLKESEVLALKQWLDANLNLAGNYPFDRVIEVVKSALEDGYLSQTELGEMLSLFKKFTRPVEECSSSNCVDSFMGKQICLTGQFNLGSRTDVAQLFEKLGAICKGSVTGKTDYVIVGDQGSVDWSCGSYGAKIKRAMELQSKGVKIQILKESDLPDFIKES